MMYIGGAAIGVLVFAGTPQMIGLWMVSSIAAVLLGYLWDRGK